jgi:hypothetical protein
MITSVTRSIVSNVTPRSPGGCEIARQAGAMPAPEILQFPQQPFEFVFAPSSSLNYEYNA